MSLDLLTAAESSGLLGPGDPASLPPRLRLPTISVFRDPLATGASSGLLPCEYRISGLCAVPTTGVPPISTLPGRGAGTKWSPDADPFRERGGVMFGS